MNGKQRTAFRQRIGYFAIGRNTGLQNLPFDCYDGLSLARWQQLFIGPADETAGFIVPLRTAYPRVTKIRVLTKDVNIRISQRRFEEFFRAIRFDSARVSPIFVVPANWLNLL
jgi:hypothetical protein